MFFGANHANLVIFDIDIASCNYLLCNVTMSANGFRICLLFKTMLQHYFYHRSDTWDSTGHLHSPCCKNRKKFTSKHGYAYRVQQRYEEKKQTHRWSWRLKVFPQRLHAYLRSELCVNLCFANALELLNSL